jgi:hypothetical protein
LTIIAAGGGAGSLVTRFDFKPISITRMLFLAGTIVWFTEVPAAPS